MTSPDRIWTPERLIHYPLITDLDLSSDGAQVVYSVREPVLTEEESAFVTHLYRVPAEGGEAIRLTYGSTSNGFPRWSPDGCYIAFLSDRADEKKNVCVMRTDGGEAWPLTKAEKDVQALAWSPDGRRLAFTLVPPDTDEKKAATKAGNDPVLWGVDHERAHLWMVPFVPGGEELPEPVDLTEDDRHVTSFDWTPDGSALAFTYQPTPVADTWPQTRLALVEASQSAPTTRELGVLPTWQPACKVHGQLIACPCGVEPLSWTVVDRIVLIPLDGGPRRPLEMTPEAKPSVLGWSSDGSQVYVLETSRTSSAIRAVPVDGSEPITLIEGEGYLSNVKANGCGAFALVAQDTDRPNRICVMNAGSPKWRDVTQPKAPDWPHDRVPVSEVIRWSSFDGSEIEGILTMPLGYQPGHPCPTLVVVHGGPAGVFSQSYVAVPSPYPLASFAERGYAILRVNPRGSSGYGPGFRAANKRDWGGGDYRDIMSGVDYLIERGIADPERLGIMGWSYGGYMTSWAITQTSRFGAASVGAGVTNLMSKVGTTDIPSFIPDYFEAEFWDDPEIYRKHSAMFNIKEVTTPTLIQHGEKDERVPLGQGLELYNALKRQGVAVEMIIYPRQKHGPDEPRLLMDIMRRNLDWFDRWILQETSS